MILTRLTELYDRLATDEEFSVKLPRQGMSVQKISFIVVLTENGELVDVIDAKVQRTLPPLKKGGKEKVDQVPREILVCGGAHPPGFAATPRFLWDSPAYIFGYYPEKAKKKEKDLKKAREVLSPAYREYHRAFLEKIGTVDKGLLAVCKFLDSFNPESISGDLRDKLNKYGDNFGVFQLLGSTEYVHESPVIQDAWQTKLSTEESFVTGFSLDTGEVCHLARLIEPKIKIGTAVGGAAFASFNDQAYVSYGKDQAFNSPISASGAFKACNALNTLIADPRYHLKVAGTTVVFWTEKRTATVDVLSWALGDAAVDDSALDPVVAKKLGVFWRLVAKASDPDSADMEKEMETPFYMLGIEPNAARLVVRFWHESTLGDFVAKLRRHHADLAIEKRFDSDPDHLSLRRILLETAREAKNVPPLLSGALLRSVIEGLPYPTSLYQLVLNRVNVSHVDSANGKYRCGSKVSYAQASIIKAFLKRNKNKGELKMGLNTENKDPAYLLGRLFATMEKVQDESSGGVNAGVGDKFYSSASATPRIVFPTVLDMYRKWIKKLESEKKGRAVFFEKLVQDIIDGIDPDNGFPANLSLEDRGTFAIGYYQQMRSFFVKSEESDATEKTV